MKNKQTNIGAYSGTIASDLLVPLVIDAYNWQYSFWLFSKQNKQT